jgi:hypothetical protein
MTLPLCLAFAALAGAPPEALSGRAVVVAGQYQAQGAVLEAALRARGLQLMSDDERGGLDGVVGLAAPGDRQRVRALILSARAAYRQLDLEGASVELAAALNEAMRLERPEDQLETIIDALIFQAALRLGDGDGPGALAALRLATRLEPGRTALDEALHPPSMVAAWSQARSENDDASRALVVVRPRLLGADGVTVIVDGVVVDVQEGLLELPTGPHLFTLRAEGCRSTSRVVDVVDGDVVIDDVVIADRVVAERAALVARINAGDAESLAQLQGATDAAIVIALDVPPGGVFAFAPGALVKKLPVGPSDDAVDIVNAAIDATRPPPPPPSLTTSAPDDDLSVWAAIVPIGAGVVLAGVGLTVWALFPGEAPPEPPRPIRVVGVVQ